MACNLHIPTSIPEMPGQRSEAGALGACVWLLVFPWRSSVLTRVVANRFRPAVGRPGRTNGPRSFFNKLQKVQQIVPYSEKCPFVPLEGGTVLACPLQALDTVVFTIIVQVLSLSLSLLQCLSLQPQNIVV